MAILVLASHDDEHATVVAREINRLGGAAEIVDLSAFPEHVRLSMHYDCCGGREFALELPGGHRNVGDFGSVWWRRPQTPLVSSDITRPTHRLFAVNEAQEALYGLWHTLDAFWVNDPSRDLVAHRKPFQLQVAQDVGLRVPVTLITNDPDEARSFVDARGYRDVVYKSFSATETEWRETRIMRQEELSLLDQVRYAPVIFQEYIEALYDLRVTVVGDEIFAAAIHSQQTAYTVDFRMDIENAEVEAVSLPSEVEGALRSLMTRLGLVYGAIDMRRTPDDRYVFLEINPAGQWLFIEQRSGQPIAAALAEILVTNDRVGAGALANGVVAGAGTA
jgi:glutathione synthase/RimK-type ligase-like ATP-grasp enzyme